MLEHGLSVGGDPGFDEIDVDAFRLIFLLLELFLLDLFLLSSLLETLELADLLLCKTFYLFHIVFEFA